MHEQYLRNPLWFYYLSFHLEILEAIVFDMNSIPGLLHCRLFITEKKGKKNSMVICFVT